MNTHLFEINDRIRQAISEFHPSRPEILSHEAHDGGCDSEDPIRKIVQRICADQPYEIQKRIATEYFCAGPIEGLLLDPEITEIIVNGADSIWYEKQGTLHRLNDQFLSELSYHNFISRMCREAGIQTTLDCPFADGYWRGNRVHLITPPTSGDQAVITLRRHPLQSWTFDSLLTHNWASSEHIEILRDLIQDKVNFLVIGSTGSGKTSVLNACLNEISHRERVVTIEDTSELRPPNKVSTKLLTRNDSAGLLRTIDQSELLKQCLRMRPDRIVMGEVRGGEAKDLLMAFATGHSGCMGTLHAESARQALLRLEMLVQIGAPQWSLPTVRHLIFLSLGAIVVVRRSQDGQRNLDGIYKISSLEEIGFLIEAMEPKKGKMTRSHP